MCVGESTPAAHRQAGELNKSKAFAATGGAAQGPRSFTVSEESHEQRHARFARIRRAKWLLRFTPRRASLHRYPLIGRFADLARVRSYLWSFRSEHVRPALYAGSVTALLPIMGVQLPVAFVLALLLRCNVMILGGLQFITNPFTIWFIYPATYQVGKTLIHASGFNPGGDVTVHEVTTFEREVLDAEPEDALPEDLPLEDLRWTRRFANVANALVLGGVISGCLLGFVLDLLWRFGVARAEKHRAKLAAAPPRSRSTSRRTPPM
jgi:uncharacterized protein (DUF2062 family)